MKKLLLLMLILIFMASFMLTGCNKDEPLKIVFLGDSIAEALAGMTPISERDNYGYYSLIGRRNGYIFKNRAISGYKSQGLLDIIKQQEDTDARMLRTLLTTSDIIHISILGNDLLLSNLGEIIYSAAQNNFDKINGIIAEAEDNFAEIVSVLKGYNPDAVIMFQTVYNPVFTDSILITAETRVKLEALGIYETQHRELAGNILAMLNGVIHNYLAEHPGAFYIIDACAEFERIYQADPERGKALIFTDYVHPSSEGHAVMADLIQAKLEELKLASKKPAVKKYREIKIEQLERMYKDTVNVKAVKRQLKKADTCEEITEIYFRAIRDKMPAYAD